MLAYVPSSRLVGPSRLDNYRLAFTRRSKRTRTGVADIVPCEGMSVWGALYDLDSDDLAKLERKEGYPSAYGYIDIEAILSENKQRFSALAFTVSNKSDSEYAPSNAYLDKIIVGARAINLPDQYITFLKQFSNSKDSDLCSGFLVRGTRNRHGSRGESVIRVSRDAAVKFGLKTYCVVSYRDCSAIARVIASPEVVDIVCELDQNLRCVLGMRGLRSFGYRVQMASLSLSPLSRIFTWSRQLVRPRSLVLPAHQPYWLDSEKNICVLHHSNIALLGLQEGQYCTLIACIRQADGKFRRKEIGIRVFSGTTAMLGMGTISQREYPKADEVYVDNDTRLELGLPQDSIGYPLQIIPNIPRLFMDRLVFYGITLFLGTEAILRLAEAASSFIKLSVRVQTIGAIIVAVVTTIALAVIDLRSKLRY
jgi:gamma-glutamylcyclotransferase